MENRTVGADVFGIVQLKREICVTGNKEQTMLTQESFNRLAAAQNIDDIVACINEKHAAKYHDLDTIVKHIRTEYARESLFDSGFANRHARARVALISGCTGIQYANLYHGH